MRSSSINCNTAYCSLIHCNFLPTIHSNIRQKNCIFYCYLFTSQAKLQKRNNSPSGSNYPENKILITDVDNLIIKNNYKKCLYSCLIILQYLTQCCNHLSTRQPNKVRFLSGLGGKKNVFQKTIKRFVPAHLTAISNAAKSSSPQLAVKFGRKIT